MIKNIQKLSKNDKNIKKEKKEKVDGNIYLKVESYLNFINIIELIG
jgi:hypothetical protein